MLLMLLCVLSGIWRPLFSISRPLFLSLSDPSSSSAGSRKGRARWILHGSSAGARARGNSPATSSRTSLNMKRRRQGCQDGDGVKADGGETARFAERHTRIHNGNVGCSSSCTLRKGCFHPRPCVQSFLVQSTGSDTRISQCSWERVQVR